MKNQATQPKVIKLTETEFWEQFKPLKNTLDDNASFDGCMYETFGKELEKVRSIFETNPLTVWTIVDCDGELVISAGYGFVDRAGYLVTEVPAEAGVEYIIENENDEVIDVRCIESLASIMMQDIVGDYDTPDEIPEWEWVQANATFTHVRNGQDGIHDFALNMSRSFEDVPDSLKPYITEAKSKNIAYLIFHQGT
jgi:hypothetical protein